MGNYNEYKSNSNKSKKEEPEVDKEKKLEKVVTGSAITKKKRGLKKFTDVFVAEDVSTVKSYILTDVLIPTIKKALYDVVTNGLDMFLNGSSTNRRRNTKSGLYAYSDAYDRKTAETADTRRGCSYDDIVIPDRTEALEVLSKLDELISVYGTASVADLYELVGISGKYTDNKYGWTNLASADVVRVREGYLLKLPRPMPLG